MISQSEVWLLDVSGNKITSPSLREVNFFHGLSDFQAGLENKVQIVDTTLKGFDYGKHFEVDFFQLNPIPEGQDSCEQIYSVKMITQSDLNYPKVVS